MAERFPSLFVSHGTPMLAFGEDTFSDMLSSFAATFPAPKGIIVLSAHSVSSREVFVSASKENNIQHDFSGFPKALYEIDYHCPGSPDLALKALELLKLSNIAAKQDENAPLDHGIWVPLMHLYPQGNVPVVRVSLPINESPAFIMKIGKALASLREQGILLIGTGGAVHNLRLLKWNEKNTEGEPWAQEFENWLIENLNSKNVENLVMAEDHPLFQKAHPTTEHYLPILFSIGAALPGDTATILNRKIEYGSLSMLCFSLNREEAAKASKEPKTHLH